MKKKIGAFLLGMSLLVSATAWGASYSPGEKIKLDSSMNLEYGQFGLQRVKSDDEYQGKGVFGKIIEIYDKDSDGIYKSIGKVEMLGDSMDSYYIYMPYNTKNTQGKLCNEKAEIIIGNIKSYSILEGSNILSYTDKDGNSGYFDVVKKKIIDVAQYTYNGDSNIEYRNVDGTPYLLIVKKTGENLQWYKGGAEAGRRIVVLDLNTEKPLVTVAAEDKVDEIVFKKIGNMKDMMLLQCYKTERKRARNGRYYDYRIEEEIIILDAQGEPNYLNFDGYNYYESEYENYGDNYTLIFRKYSGNNDGKYKYKFYTPDDKKLVEFKGLYDRIMPFDEEIAVAFIDRGKMIALDINENIIAMPEEYFFDYDGFVDVLIDEKTKKPVYIFTSVNFVQIYNGEEIKTLINLVGELNREVSRASKVVDGVVYFDNYKLKPLVDSQDSNVEYEKIVTSEVDHAREAKKAKLDKLAIEDCFKKDRTHDGLYILTSVEKLGQISIDLPLAGDVEYDFSDNYVFVYKDWNNFDRNDFMTVSNRYGETVLSTSQSEGNEIGKEINKNVIYYKSHGKAHLYFVNEDKDLEFDGDLIGYSSNISYGNLDSLVFSKLVDGNLIIVDKDGKNLYPDFSAAWMVRINDEIISYQLFSGNMGIIKVKSDGTLDIQKAIYKEVKGLAYSDKILVKNVIGLTGVLNKDASEFLKAEFDNIEYANDQLFLTKEGRDYYLHRVLK